MNIEKARAEHAYNTIKDLPEDVKKYTSYVKVLPAAILQNGLGQAMATLLAASKGNLAMENGEVVSAHRLLFSHIQRWLCRDEPLAPFRTENGADDDSDILMEKITSNNEEFYIRAQTEALAYLTWLKKFASAFLPEGEDR